MWFDKTSKIERTEKREMKRYEKKYGEGTWENHLFAERLIKRMERENKYLYLSQQHLNREKFTEDEYGYNHWVRIIVSGDKWSVRELFTRFEYRYQLLENTGVGIEKYKWLLEFSNKFLETDLDNMILFQNYVWELCNQQELWGKTVKQLEDNGIDSKTHSGAQKMKAIMAGTMLKMETLLNPVTKRFHDDTSKAEQLSKNVNDKIHKMLASIGNQEFQKQNPIEQSAPENRYQLESVRQLNAILKNEKVSNETKQKVRATIQEIESGLDSDVEQKEREEAEMEAEAVLQASIIVHKLKGKTLY